MYFIYLKVGLPGISVASKVFFIEYVEFVPICLELHPLVLVIETFDTLSDWDKDIIPRVKMIRLDRRLGSDYQVVVEHRPRTIESNIAVSFGRLDVIAFKVV